MKKQGHFNEALMLTLSLTLVGCTPNLELNPPKKGEFVELSINVQEGFLAHDVQIIYRSKHCPHSGYSLANGLKITRDGYQKLTLKPMPQPNGNLHISKIPLDGGGSCNWKLSNIIFAVGYKSTERFPSATALGSPARIIIRYDDNRPPISGGREEIAKKNLSLTADYYPWIHERFTSGYRKSVRLTGKHGSDTNYYAPKIRKIYFNPVMHNQFLVNSTEDKNISTGPDPLFFYPDGSIQPEKMRQPNFVKLQSIRAKAEKAQQ